MTFDPRWKLPQGKSPDQIYTWAEALIKELRKGSYLPTVLTDAADIAYDNATSGLTATDTQAAIDEVEGRVDTLEASPPGLVLLASGVISSPQATLDIPLTSYTSYRAIKILLSNFVPATDDVELWLRFSTDGGSNYDAGASDYAWHNGGGRDNSTSVIGQNDSADSELRVAGSSTSGEAISNVAAEGGADVEVNLFGQAVSRWQRARWNSQHFGATVTDNFWWTGAGAREAQQDTDAVRFLFETGNITSGNWAVYGYA